MRYFWFNGMNGDNHMESRDTPEKRKSTPEADNDARSRIRLPAALAERIATQAKSRGITIAEEIERLLALDDRAEIPRLIQEAVSDSIDSHLIPLAQKQAKDMLAMERTLQDFVFQLRDVLRGESGAKG